MKVTSDREDTTTFRLFPDPRLPDNLADQAVQFSADWIYFARAGQYNGVSGDSPFAAVLVVGLYTASDRPDDTLATADRVLLVGSAKLHVTADPRLSERTRRSLAAKLREIALGLDSEDSPRKPTDAP